MELLSAGGTHSPSVHREARQTIDCLAHYDMRSNRLFFFELVGLLLLSSSVVGLQFFLFIF